MDKYELCKVCVHTGDCEHQRGREQVFQCEEFKGERPKARKSGRKRRRAAGRKKKTPVRSS